MTVAELSDQALSRELRSPGIHLATGPFVFHLRTAIPALAEAIRFLYRDFPLDGADAIVDFRVAVQRPVGLRRWVRPQAIFLLDGWVPFEPVPLDLALPTLEWGLNWCVASHAQQYLMMHAAVVEREGRAIILPGRPGSGKSTLCAALVHRGWRLLSDEFALLRPDGRLAAWPRPISLKNQSIDVIRRLAPEAVIGPSVADTAKGTVAHMRPPTPSVERAAEAAYPAFVVFPTYQAGAPTRLSPLTKPKAFFQLADHSFNYAALGEDGFEILAGVTERSDAFEFTYSDLEDAVALVGGLEPGSARNRRGG